MAKIEAKTVREAMRGLEWASRKAAGNGWFLTALVLALGHDFLGEIARPRSVDVPPPPPMTVTINYGGSDE